MHLESVREITSPSQLGKEPYLKLHQLSYTLNDGSQKNFEVVSRRHLTDRDFAPEAPVHVDGASCIVASKGGGRLLLIQEFRPALNRAVWRLPEGMCEPGEHPVDCALRELWEETGIPPEQAAYVTSYGSYASDAMAGIFLETVFLRSRCDSPLQPQDNPAEEITARWFSQSEARELLAAQKEPYGPASPQGPISTRALMAILWFLSQPDEDDSAGTF